MMDEEESFSYARQFFSPDELTTPLPGGIVSATSNAEGSSLKSYDDSRL